jgi:hypothetical protein
MKNETNAAVGGRAKRVMPRLDKVYPFTDSSIF